MRKLLTFSLLIISLNSVAQRYQAADIIKRADSVIISKVGKKVFDQYFAYSYSNFEYSNWLGKPKTKVLRKTGQTNGKFHVARVVYAFCLKVYNVDCIRNWVYLDNKSIIKTTIQMEYIPEYVWNQDTCNFISDQRALEIAASVFKKKGMKTPEKTLFYDDQINRYLWRVTQKITEFENGRGETYGEIEIVELDALTGSIKSHYPDAVYAPLH
jgi:hypothetical protein